MSQPTGNVRWIVKAVLVASLTANAGLTWMLLKPRPARIAQVAPINTFRAVTGRLPPEDAALLQSAVEKRAGILRNAQQAYEADVGRVLDEVARNPFDVQAARRAIEQARSQRELAADALIEAVLETLPSMSAEGRKALTETTRKRAALPVP